MTHGPPLGESPPPTHPCSPAPRLRAPAVWLFRWMSHKQFDFPPQTDSVLPFCRSPLLVAGGGTRFCTSAADAANDQRVGEGVGISDGGIRRRMVEAEFCLCPCRFQRLGPQGAAAGRLRGAAQHGPEEGAAQASRLRTHPRRYRAESRSSTCLSVAANHNHPPLIGVVASPSVKPLPGYATNRC